MKKGIAILLCCLFGHVWGQSLPTPEWEGRHEGQYGDLFFFTGSQSWNHEDGTPEARVDYNEEGEILGYKTWDAEGNLMEDYEYSEHRERQRLPELSFVFEDNGLGLMLLGGAGKDEPSPIPGDRVYVSYSGFLQDGTIFDSNLSGKPLKFKFGEGEVIPGFEQAVAMLHVGDSGYFFIPPDLAYQGHCGGLLPPYAALIFKITLVDMK